MSDEKNRHNIVVKGRAYSFMSSDIKDEIDLDKEISIDYSNLQGDSYVTPLVSNAIGMLKSELEYEVKMAELNVSIWVEKFKKSRRQSGEKITEKELEKSYCAEPEWISLMNDRYIKELYLAKIGVVYWKINDKLEKLKNFQKEVIPNDMEDEIIEKSLKKKSVKIGGLTN